MLKKCRMASILLTGMIVIIMAGCESDTTDETAPKPNPMTWASPPEATGATSIEMTADTASDTSSVQYYFECETDDTASSGWQSSSSYEAENLKPGTLYTFRVRARDASEARNKTEWSSSDTATTDTSPWWQGAATDYFHPTPTGTNRVLLVFCHAANSTDPEEALPVDFTAVSYGGQPLTEVVEHHQNQTDQFTATAEIWMLDEAGIQAAEADQDDTISITTDTETITAEDPTENEGIRISSCFYQNVDQADPIGETGTDGENDNEEQTLTVTLTGGDLDAGDMVLGNCTIRPDVSGADEVDWTWQNSFVELGVYTGTDDNLNDDEDPPVLAYSVADLTAESNVESVTVDVLNNGVGGLAACVLNHAAGLQVSTIE